MTDINDTKLRRLDMTMLLVFTETLKHRKLGAAAVRLGLTQPAISHTLTRLREVFGDPLFLRRPHGVEPTAHALAIAPRIEMILEAAQASLSGPQAFQPAETTVRFRIAALDYEAAVFGPRLCKVLAEQAPGASLVFRSLSHARAIDALDDGEVDLLLGFVPGLPDSYGRHVFYNEDYVVAHRKGLRLAPSLDGYLAREHLLVSFTGEPRGLVDDTLATRGLSRRIRAVFPLFLPALAAVAETGLLATLPRRLAESQAKRFGLAVRAPPVMLRSFPVRAMWHPRSDRDPKIKWLVERIASVSPG